MRRDVLFITTDFSLMIIFHIYSIYSILRVFIDEFLYHHEKNLSKKQLLKVLIGRLVKSAKLNSLHKVAS